MECFDLESGQVYRETTVKPRQEPFKEWHHRCAGTKRQNALSPQGADSLMAMTFRILSRQSGQLTSETLAALPARIVRQIFATIRRSGCDSFHTWQMFAESGHTNKMPRHIIRIGPLYKPLVNYFADMTSNRFAWMVDLTLTDLYCSRLDVRQLARLCNLQTLYVQYSNALSDDRAPFDDSTLSNLANCAATDGSLSRLQMIFVRNACGISVKSFAHLGKFPRLDTFCVLDTSIKLRHTSIASKIGWYGDTESRFLSYVNTQVIRAPYDLMRRTAHFSKMVEGYIQKRRPEASKNDCDVPCASIFFGSDSRDSRYNGSPCEIVDMLCFERNWTVAGFGKDSDDSTSLSAAADTAKDASQPTKKRKLKHGQSIALDAMLEGL